MMRLLRTAAIAAALLALIATAGVFGASYYYTSQHGQGCASCHEMAVAVNGMQVSAHRGLGCLECHNENLAAKLRHVRVHLLGGGPEIIRLRGADVLEMVPIARGATSRSMPRGMPGRTAPVTARSSPTRRRTRASD